MIPQSDDAEKAVLSSIVQWPKHVLPVCSAELREGYFFAQPHALIYSELVAMWDAGEAVDNVTLCQRLIDRKLLDKVGGPSFIASLAYYAAPGIEAVKHYIGILREKFIARRIMALCESYGKRATDEEPLDLLTELQSEFLALSDVQPRQARSMKELVAASIEEIEESFKSHGQGKGLTTGFVDLDRKSGAMKPGQLIIIAADTAKGKTTLALNIAEHCALDLQKPVGIVSLEMGGTELTQRLLASVGKVNVHNIMSGGGTNGDFNRLTSSAARVKDAPIFVRDESDVDPVRLRGAGRQLKHEHKIELLVVDYVQLLTPTAVKDENRERAMSAAAQALKQMARELNIVVIGLSQVNENGKLRESRAIGHHADKVITITHDEMEPAIAYLNIDKNRSGPTGTVSVTFMREYTKFCNLAAA